MATDLSASVEQALVTHLAAKVPGATVRRGWPEHGVTLPLEAGPVIAVTVGELDEDRSNPYPVGAVKGGALVTTTYRIAEVRAPVQIDVWASYRTKLDAALALVDAALVNQTPHSSGLWLAQADYFDRPITFEVTGLRREPADDELARGEWRATYLLDMTTDRVTQVVHPATTTITATVTSSGGDSTDAVESATLAG